MLLKAGDDAAGGHYDERGPAVSAGIARCNPRNAKPVVSPAAGAELVRLRRGTVVRQFAGDHGRYPVKSFGEGGAKV